MSAPKLSWKGAQEVCPVCGVNVKLTATGRFSTHGAKANRCSTSGAMSPTAILAERDGGTSIRLMVRTWSYQQRIIYTLAHPFRVVTDDGRALWCAAIVVTQESGGRKYARGVGMLGHDEAPQEYRMTPDWERDVLTQIGHVR